MAKIKKLKLQELEDIKDQFGIVFTEYDLVVTFKGKNFIRVNKNMLVDLCVDYLPKEAAKKIFEREKSIIEITEIKKHNKNVNVEADALLRVFYQQKDKYYKTDSVRRVSPTKPEYKHFVKAVEIMKLHNATPQEFMLAQLDGLAFLENKGSSFPTPQQLATTGAEDRLLKYRHKVTKMGAENTFKKEFKIIPITVYDKETPLTENPKFLERLELVRNETATLQQATFVKDLLETKRGKGKALPEVYSLIKKLKGSN